MCCVYHVSMTFIWRSVPPSSVRLWLNIALLLDSLNVLSTGCMVGVCLFGPASVMVFFYWKIWTKKLLLQEKELHLHPSAAKSRS